MNDCDVECPSCGWLGKMSETNDMDGPTGEEIPICPECFMHEELVPVSLPLPSTVECKRE